MATEVTDSVIKAGKQKSDNARQYWDKVARWGVVTGEIYSKLEWKSS